MFSASNLCKKTSQITYMVFQSRSKTKVHWAKLKKKNSPKDKALDHFNDFYSSVFGNKWETIREAILRRTKYVAVVNNYGDTEKTIEYLSNRGAHCLKKLMAVQQEFHDQYRPAPTVPKPTETNVQSKHLPNRKLEEYTAKLQTDEISKIYPNSDYLPEKLEATDITLHRNVMEKKEDESRLLIKNLEQSIADAEIDMSRIIDPSIGMTSEALYQYLPATKLKGLDDWLPESVHYSYYDKGADFPLVVQPETEFTYPEHLKVYTYEMNSDYTTFPEPKRGQTGVFNYYPMDCGSVLAVLALCLAPGDRVLDLCSAPGGKALVALQTLLPDHVVCNDSSISRSNRIERIFSDYFYDFMTSPSWRERVLLSRGVDGRAFTDDAGFDKVLVDVPCTTDRLSLTKVEDNNIFRADRIKERLKLPELQSELLLNALSLVKVGGAVVYSTCSLSPIQNDGVVHMALKQAFESRSIVAAVRDLSSSMTALSSTLVLASGSIAPRYGQLVLPSLRANFGPTYVSRLVRVK